MSYAECPYCSAEVEINHDDGYGYEEGKNHNQECRECGKTFLFQTVISFYYDTEKTDCLNGGAHDFEKINRYGSSGRIGVIKCKGCGHEQS